MMIKLSKFLEENLIEFNLKSNNKNDVIKELVEMASQSKLVKDKDELLRAVNEREELVTTGVGYGVAFPHAKTRSVRGIVIAFGKSDEGIDFEAMDKKPVHLFFLIAAPEDAIGAHLNVMAELSFLMKSEENRDRLMEARNYDDVLDVLDTKRT
ncbi:MAG: PTS fructose transporter subunit IIA [candidate division Zixibacteria bacterium]|nr:PTS fructose transporter subunit IIA [candidate division Zixibacteria bacterium]